MPLPEPSEQEGESVKAGQEPSPESPEPGTDVILAVPTKPKEFSKLVLLTASTENVDGVDSQPKGGRCVMSLEMSGPDTLARTPQILPVEEQVGAVQPTPQVPEQTCSKPDTAAPKPLEFLRTPFGGRLLVLECFLYKQEKAVGDKVYWKCREHCELGCRGRAITRGPRATVMRGHCHPPDEEGLEARRRRQKLPGPALPEGLGVPEGPRGRVEEPLEGVGPWLCPEEPEPTPGLVLSKPAAEEDEGLRALSLLSLPPKKRPKLGIGEPRPLEFLRTCYGGSFLVHQSFLYKREKAVGDKVYWTCRDHALHSCRSRAITQGQRVTVMRGHCHPPDVEGLEARRQQEKAVETLQARPGGPGGQVDKLLQGVDSLLYRRGPGTLTLTRARPRKHAKVLPAQPQAPQGSPTEDPDEAPGGPEFLRTPLGGSFLVYESFLYRREKAAGEKVYWTCRDQARMGCRSRAITQGQRVMVMRRHCHPPDLGGLEALRQREQLPSPAQREGSGTLRPLEFLRTSLGGRFLVYESFLYRKEKAAGEKVYWMCRDQARLGCRSRAITQGQLVTVMRSHCHPPDLAGLEALRQRERLPSVAQQEDPEKMKLPPEAQVCIQPGSPESQQMCGAGGLHVSSRVSQEPCFGGVSERANKSARSWRLAGVRDLGQKVRPTKELKKRLSTKRPLPCAAAPSREHPSIFRARDFAKDGPVWCGRTRRRCRCFRLSCSRGAPAPPPRVFRAGAKWTFALLGHLLLRCSRPSWRQSKPKQGPHYTPCRSLSPLQASDLNQGQGRPSRCRSRQREPARMPTGSRGRHQRAAMSG
ncbi:PREDICTED: FLYWCH-type zinc finger-containing protein 1 [Odobenus rosmarus divergens]|uniref:FLYWCH-type zinc finger-containing protein 1 n=1 Tax=Odobenus rosmarus divergens TaxID=9708 RepID=A0A2U3W5I2_ODORO|nr:PREDICTED: FLYWCH-type zinc finger-containing protein 1 [Odobenus rosmarus divergens]